MPLIPTSHVIEGALVGLNNPGAPVNGTNEVQTLTFGGTWVNGETFTLTFDGHTTAPIAWNSTNSTLVSNIDAALESLSTIGTGGVTTATGTMTSGIGTITVTAAGALAKLAISTLVIGENNSEEGTLGVAETTPGVTATARGAGKGATLHDTTNGVLYINTGTPTEPTWTKVGTQS